MNKPVNIAETLAAMTVEQRAVVEALLTNARTASQPKVTISVGKAGGVCVRHGSRFPTTLYASQWLRVLDHADAIRAFIEANRSALAWKTQD